MGLMQPVLNGIGGDLFAIVYDPKTKKLYGYNGSGRAAMARDLGSMKAKVEAAYTKAGMKPVPHIPPVGSLPITVPGAGRCVVRAARQVRQAADERGPCARDPLRERRLARDAAHQRLLERQHGRVSRRTRA